MLSNHESERSIGESPGPDEQGVSSLEPGQEKLLLHAKRLAARKKAEIQAARSLRQEAYIPLGDIVRTLRLQRNESSKSVAFRTGIAPETLFMIENSRSSPRADRIVRLARAFDTSVSYLFQETANPAPDAVERISHGSVGQNIQALLRERRMTLPRLAAHTGIGYQTLTNIVRNDASPLETTLRKIAPGFGVPVGRLFGEVVRDPSESAET